jgi:hypothetical protein
VKRTLNCLILFIAGCSSDPTSITEGGAGGGAISSGGASGGSGGTGTGGTGTGGASSGLVY